MFPSEDQTATRAKSDVQGGLHPSSPCTQSASLFVPFSKPAGLFSAPLYTNLAFLLGPKKKEISVCVCVCAYVKLGFMRKSGHFSLTLNQE